MENAWDEIQSLSKNSNNIEGNGTTQTNAEAYHHDEQDDQQNTDRNQTTVDFHNREHRQLISNAAKNRLHPFN